MTTIKPGAGKPLKHHCFCVELDPEVLTPPTCGSPVRDGDVLTTHYEFATCELCQRLVLATLWRVFGPEEHQRAIDGGMTPEARLAEASALRRLVRDHAEMPETDE